MKSSIVTHRQPGVRERGGGPAGRDELDAEAASPRGELAIPGLVTDADSSARCTRTSPGAAAGNVSLVATARRSLSRRLDDADHARIRRVAAQPAFGGEPHGTRQQLVLERPQVLQHLVDRTGRGSSPRACRITGPVSIPAST